MLLVGRATRSCRQLWIGELVAGLMIVWRLLFLAGLGHFIAVVFAPALVVAFLDEQLTFGTQVPVSQLLLVLPKSSEALPLLFFLILFTLLGRVHAVHANVRGEQLFLGMMKLLLLACHEQTLILIVNLQ